MSGPMCVAAPNFFPKFIASLLLILSFLLPPMQLIKRDEVVSNSGIGM